MENTYLTLYGQVRNLRFICILGFRARVSKGLGLWLQLGLGLGWVRAGGTNIFTSITVDTAAVLSSNS